MAEDETQTTASAVKARRRGASKPRAATSGEQQTAEPTPESEPSPAPGPVGAPLPAPITHSTGISSHSLGGPATVVGSFVSEGVTASSAGEYVRPDKPGYYAYYPPHTHQPSTVLAWSAGQQVRRDYFEAYGGENAPSRPEHARPINEPGGGVSSGRR